MNPFSLKDRQILIVGATADIGKAIASVCCDAGACLTLTGRSIDSLSEVKRNLNVDDSCSVELVYCDLSKEDEVENLVTNVPKQDGLVVVAGTLETIPCKMHVAESVDRAMDVNFRSVVILVSALLRAKKVNKNASLVFLSSIAGNLLAEKGNALYGASKAALTAYAKTLALELSPRKIRVNCVMPGMVRTKFLQNFAIEEEDFVADEQKYPLGYGTPEDVANGVLYLLSDASRWITGTSLVMDGGRTLQ